ncbi:hypothetical protein K491DRAFT_118941 [Lophiostoma macrostomum CBS 122681]|uniref:BTB domain-containing protein n=1 Tax=Lophiostoma macrostomum CBS 122681 TaxID=1314788 RepID=A0A6A6SUT5_9PLEO|nr:hypothetical protein K491DRAFT_118941 [Lophiostoma macrostomum CBS 122681]
MKNSYARSLLGSKFDFKRNAKLPELTTSNADMEPEGFDLYIKWLYKKEVPTLIPDNDDADFEQHFLVLTKAWVAGSILGDWKFQSIMTKQIVCDLEDAPILPNPRTVQYVFTLRLPLASANSKIQELILALFGKYAIPQEIAFWDLVEEPWAREFMSRLIKTFMTLRDNPRARNNSDIIRRCTVSAPASDVPDGPE